jgi:membrane-associated phospholipid phosphatase
MGVNMKTTHTGWFILLLVVMVGTVSGNTQDVENPKQEKKRESFLNSLVKDQAEILTSPVRIKGRDWIVWGSMALVTGILIANDESIYQSIKNFQDDHDWISQVSPLVTPLGDGALNLGIAGGFFLGGVLLKDQKAKETARLLLMTFIHGGIVVQLGKHLSGRQRPWYEDGSDHWYGPSGFFKRYSESFSKYDAFPSGHTIMAWGTATVIAEMYKSKPLVPIICYSLATLAGLSRVTEDQHWLSDVFVGAVLGYAIGKFVVRKRGTTWNLVPVIQDRSAGIGISYIF